MRLIVFLAAIMTSCSSYHIIRFTNTEDLNRFYVDGKEVAVLSDDKCVIAASGARDGSTLHLSLSITNISNERIDFLIRNVSLKLIDRQYQYTRDCKVYSAHEYLSKIKSRQQWAMALTAFAQGVESYNAGQSTSSTTGTYSTSSGESGTFSSSTTTRDNAAVAAQNERNMRVLSQMQSDFNTKNMSIEQLLLKDNTILPLRTISGQIAADAGHGQEYELSILLDTRTYKFSFKMMTP